MNSPIKASRSVKLTTALNPKVKNSMLQQLTQHYHEQGDSKPILDSEANDFSSWANAPI